MEPLRPEDPREIGPYRLERRLGGGGMGQVFLGRSRGGRPVAVKVVRPELAGDAGFRRRFTLEAEAARRVGGFYTAQVVDADPDADPPWLVTAYIPGPSLQEAVTRHGPLPESVIGVLGLGLAEGLAAIHGCDLVHRDLKPSNVILAEDGPRVIDFGIARALDATSHTTPRAVLGTPSFMSPEQARGGDVGPPSDVFSLASVLVFAATGRTPFGTGSPHGLPYRIVHEEPDLSGVPALLRELLTACFAKDPAARPAVADVLDRLDVPGLASTRWLPPDLTTLITERRAATRTAEPVLRGTEPAATSGTPSVPSARATEQATLEIGSLAGCVFDVVVDGKTLGKIAPGGRRSFHLTPGSHSLQVRADRRRGTPRRIDTPGGTTVRLAFGTLSAQAAPVPVDAVVFRRGTTAREITTALYGGMAAGLVAMLVAGGARGWDTLGQGITPLLIMMSGLTVGVAIFVLMSMSFGSLARSAEPQRSDGSTLRTDGLTVRPDGLVFDPGSGGEKKTVEWDVVERLSLIGDGRDAKLIAWYREGYRPPGEVDVQGGTLVCEVKDVGAGRDTAKLRAALKWFAPDLYVEQPP